MIDMVAIRDVHQSLKLRMDTRYDDDEFPFYEMERAMAHLKTIVDARTQREHDDAPWWAMRHAYRVAPALNRS